jgi:CheY-like chemotaxis protein/glycine cleavage system H lipoate-binding protein
VKYLLAAVLVFLVVDVVVRLLLRKFLEKKKRKQRHELLDKSLKVDLGREAKSLKQVKVDNPKAKILCVDDEAIILDSFRKILVLDGYSVDTVESGLEALGLIHKHHYDFVFTDLKMPEMDGAEVAKAVKEMRPDMDVIIITGYATVESAVECMKFGAMDYVQKPFTEDELLEFVERLRVARQEAIKGKSKPRVHITQLDAKTDLEFDEFAIPGGLFVSLGHCWASVEEDGLIRVGIDDFAKNVIGRVDEIELPNLRMNARRGEPLFSVRHGSEVISFNAPVSGTVAKVNQDLLNDLDELEVTTYGKNWICALDAEALDAEIGDLRIGQAVVALYQKDIGQLAAILEKDPRVQEGQQAALRKSNLSRLQFEQLSEASRREIVSRFFQQADR